MQDLPLYISNSERLDRVPRTPERVRKLVLERFDHQCPICGSYPTNLEVHHIIDRHQLLNYGHGNPHDVEMLMPACGDACHGGAKRPTRPPTWYLMKSLAARHLIDQGRIGQIEVDCGRLHLTAFAEENVWDGTDNVQSHSRILLPADVFGHNARTQAWRGIKAAVGCGGPDDILKAFARLRKVDPEAVLRKTFVAELARRVGMEHKRRAAFYYQLMYASGALWEESLHERVRSKLCEYGDRALEEYDCIGDDAGKVLTLRMLTFAAASNDRIIGLTPDETRAVRSPSMNQGDSLDAYYDRTVDRRYACEDAIRHKRLDVAVDLAAKSVHTLDVASMAERTKAYLNLALAHHERFRRDGVDEDALRALFAYSSAWEQACRYYDAEQGGDVAVRYAELLMDLGCRDLGERVLTSFCNRYDRVFRHLHNRRARDEALCRLTEFSSSARRAKAAIRGRWNRLRSLARSIVSPPV